MHAAKRRLIGHYPIVPMVIRTFQYQVQQLTSFLLVKGQIYCYNFITLHMPAITIPVYPAGYSN